MKMDNDQQFLDRMKIVRSGGDYYTYKPITDKGFNKWTNAFEGSAFWIKVMSLLVTFKFYRMTYSFFMGRKQFIVLYQKKKFKKATVMQTMLCQFLVELPLIICGVVAFSQVSPSD